ncbi:Threonine efflux protein [Marinomonas spartinae]|uniref:LysE family translocator n=1 Tax=Marinomonas spartinae TaxID=1792290 RepID=UPI000808CB00|nr:LysE family translocator [Marinomonas spartinae]SBS38741.1 Threonine efflux protein [Marinomonas spartinae]
MFEENITWLSLGMLGIAIVISPGADFVLVFKNSLSHGRRAGVWTAIGIGLAISIHIAYSLMGIHYLISHNAWLYSIIQYAGATYLIYLGVKGVLFSKTKPSIVQGDIKPPSITSHYFLQGFLCNALNPKTMLFFLSIFSQVVVPEGGSNLAAYLYGAYMILLHALWFILIACIITSTRLQNRLESMKKRLNQVCGISLLLFGFALIFRN